MKVKRELTLHNPEAFQIGDRIKVKLPEETHWATAYDQKGTVTFFIFDDCLNDLRPMNSKNTNEGGYEASELRQYLRDLSEDIPEKLKKKMVPDGNGDYLYLLTLREVTGYDTKWNKVSGQLEWFKDRRHRIATSAEDEYVDRRPSPVSTTTVVRTAATRPTLMACARLSPYLPIFNLRPLWAGQRRKRLQVGKEKE